MTEIARSPKLGKTKTRREANAVLDRECLAKFAALTADEPTPPADGSCVVCGDQRRPERSRRYAHGCADIDSFCSTLCCKRFHGVAGLQVKPPGPRPTRGYITQAAA